MKVNFVVTILVVVLLIAVGCGSPKLETSDLSQEYQKLSADYTALQSAYDTLLFNYEQLNETKKEYDVSMVRCNDLGYQLLALQTNYAVLEAQYNSMTTYYEVLFNTIAPDKDALGIMNKQYQALVERHRVVDERLAAVNAKKVKEISDNLTASELAVFYRGWNLWWETFNE